MTVSNPPESMPPKTATKRFYRPELDALRFFAFLAVLIHHGPSSPGFLDLVRRMGGFGLSMFFLLSAYLITELLLREREQTGTVAWKLFFIRRALRIWPLYYAFLAFAFLIPLIPPHRLRLPLDVLAGMSLFAINWFKYSGQLGPLLGPLWTISVEEQFYLVLPPVIKAGGRKFALIAAVFFSLLAAGWIGVFSQRGWQLWYATPVEFLFFAAGMAAALATHGKRTKEWGRLTRLCLLGAGLLFLAAAGSEQVGTDYVQVGLFGLCAGYTLAAMGCVLIFFAFLGLSSVPRPLIYLGKISYGLYVFHSGFLDFSNLATARLRLAPSSAAEMFIVDGAAVLLCIVAAHLSYRFFELPFLKLKERFEVVRSRPA